MNNLPEQIAKLRKTREYLNEDRFKHICDNAGISFDKSTFQELMRIGIFNFVERAPAKLVKALVDYADVIDGITKHILHTDECNIHWKKYIYLTEDSNEPQTAEVCLDGYEGLKKACSIYEKASKIIAVLPLCDRITTGSGNNYKATNLYRHDIIQSTEQYGNKSFVCIAVFDGNFVGGRSYYLELIYTEKYGYLNYQGKPMKDNEPLLFTESMLNYHEQEYNHRKVTWDHYKVIGNALTHLHLLKPTAGQN